MKGGSPDELKIGNDPLISYVPETKTYKFSGTNGKPKIEKIIFQKQSGYYAPFKILNIFFASVTENQDTIIDAFLAKHENIYNSIILPAPPKTHTVTPIYVSREINTYLTQNLTSKGQCYVVGSNVDGSYVVQDVKEEILYNCTLALGESINIQVSTHSF